MITISAEVIGLVFVLLVSVFVILACNLQDARRELEYCESWRNDLLKEHWSLNQHAHLLGKQVDARVYEGSPWERMVVVAVSWRGAVCVRPVRDMQTKGRWIPKNLVPLRVMEVEP
jgi:hypothetical protein